MKRMTALVLALLLALSVFPALADDFSYPMEPITLTINMAEDTTVVPDYAKDYYFWDLLDDKTGVTLEYTGAAFPYSTVSEEFQLMLASLEYPDLIQANWYVFPGGPAAALEDGYIISLNDYAEYMPNYMAALEADPALNKLLRTDNGDLYCFSRTNIASLAEVFAGPQIRQDWLEELNLEAPKTVQQWHDVLVAFRDQKGASAPFSMEARWIFVQNVGNALSSPWDTIYGFYMDGTDVKFGPMEPAFKEFVATMAQWYQEGLIDKDFASVDKATVEAKFAGGDTGICIQQKSCTQNAINANTNNPGFKVAALYTPVLHEGDTREFGQVTAPGSAGGSVSISSQCKNIEAACRFLDYFWTEEGGKFASLGTEGVSYETVDGHPQFTKLVAENPDGLSFAAARNLFSRVTWPHLHNDLDVYDTNETLREMVEVWSDTNMLAHLYPAITPTVEESDAITSTYTTIDTYCKEMIVKFIIGMEPMDRYDAFVDQLKALGIEEVLTVRQAMYDRFLAR